MMNNELDRRFLLGGLTGAAGIAALAHLAKGGPINPPAGPVASSGKTLTDVEPRIAVNAVNTPGISGTFRITQPGSYYLTDNLNSAVGQGIEIAASNVTLDLNGFTVQGAAGTGDGIFASGAFTNICILNGNVKGWGASGITLYGGVTTARISGIICTGNGGAGINAGNNTAITTCTVTGNGGAGINAGNNTAITACTVTGNGGAGITAGNSSIIEACVARNNTGAGIVAGDASLVSGCHSGFNASGITVATDCTVERCVSRGNSGVGISTADVGKVTECNSTGNANGIVVTTFCTVSNCTSASNTADGIVASLRCTLKGNQCHGNTADAIHLLAVGVGGNRIEENVCASSTRGFHAESTNNIFLRNTAQANSVHWLVVAGNNLLVLSLLGGGIVSGSAGGTALGPSGYDPNANFSH